MLHKSKSTRNALLKYGLSAPLFGAMMILSSATISNEIESIDRTLSNDPAVTVLAIPAEDFPKPVAEEMQTDPVTIPEKNTKKGQDTTVFTSVEIFPEFPGGMKAFYEYLSKNLRYSDEARKNNISGKVILQFIVEKDGKLTNIKILRGLGSGLDEEAVRVLTESPNWKPGQQNGKLVRVAYTLPISFNTKAKPDSLKAGNSPDNRMGITNANPKLLYVVDGKEMTAADFKTKVKPAMIGSINVIKGENALQKYGDRGKEGVLEIATRGYSTAGTIRPTDSGNQNISSATMSSGYMEAKKAVTIAISDRLPARALYIIDGKKYNVKDGTEKLRTISPNDIESMNVIKGERAVKEFGEQGKEGVIQITLKKK